MEKDNILFNLQNIKCSYNGQKVVLNIKKLTIPAGKIIFIVGPSGIGKSTILETLGMMNNTLLSSDMFKYKGQDLSSLWQRQTALTELRKTDFSFIFQENNLMLNFSAKENAMIAALFKGMTYEKVSEEVEKVFEKLELPLDDGPVCNISGGQKQRIAFARAILPNYSVLFGDEPTGNLDSTTAEKLMQIIRDEVHPKEENAILEGWKKSAIIVSHDMHLAVKYADMIIQIQQTEHMENETEHFVQGLIDDNSIYVRKVQWWLHQNEQYTDEKLYSKLINGLK